MKFVFGAMIIIARWLLYAAAAVVVTIVTCVIDVDQMLLWLLGALAKKLFAKVGIRL